MKRFYREVSAAPAEDGWRVLLDGRPIRSQGGRAQVVPGKALATLLAAEWAAQGEKLNPAAFPLRDMADYAIDVVAPSRAETIARLLAYAETDTLCYRADPDEPLYRRQQAEWEPLLAEIEAALGVRMLRVSGVIHRPQPPETLAALARRLEGLDDFALAALVNLASLAASLTVALAALDPAADLDRLWRAANLEEDWQVEQWGADAEAQARQDKRRAAFFLAARFAGGSSGSEPG